MRVLALIPLLVLSGCSRRMTVEQYKADTQKCEAAGMEAHVTTGWGFAATGVECWIPGHTASVTVP